MRLVCPMYLPSCSIQGLSYTHLVLSPYLYLSSLSFSGKFFVTTSSFSPFQLSLLLWGKLYFFVVQTNSFAIFPLSNIQPFFSIGGFHMTIFYAFSHQICSGA